MKVIKRTWAFWQYITISCAMTFLFSFLFCIHKWSLLVNNIPNENKRKKLIFDSYRLIKKKNFFVINLISRSSKLDLIVPTIPIQINLSITSKLTFQDYYKIFSLLINIKSIYYRTYFSTSSYNFRINTTWNTYY
jgi:hypothetical protein